MVLGGTDGSQGAGVIFKVSFDPQISSSKEASTEIGQAFSYQITASNDPTSFNASGLPPGFAINTTTGVISGQAVAAGTTIVKISTTNGFGTAAAILTLSVEAP